MSSSSAPAAMPSPREHVERIRRERYFIGRGEQNPLAEDMHQAVNYLSQELYSKDVHFLMELVQVIGVLFGISCCSCASGNLVKGINVLKFSAIGWLMCVPWKEVTALHICFCVPSIVSICLVWCQRITSLYVWINFGTTSAYTFASTICRTPVHYFEFIYT